jgi:hypothetical protein
VEIVGPSKLELSNRKRGLSFKATVLTGRQLPE